MITGSGRDRQNLSTEVLLQQGGRDDMKTEPISGAVVAVVGVWLACRDIPDFINLLRALAFSDVRTGADRIAFHSVQVLSGIVLGSLLFVFRHRILRAARYGDSRPSVDEAEWFAIGVALIGVFQIAHGVHGMIWLTAEWILNEQSGVYFILQTISSVLVGILLFLLAERSGSWWARVRGATRNAA